MNRFELPDINHKFDERAFSHAGQEAWNILQPHITATIYTETCKTILKTHLFKLAHSL